MPIADDVLTTLKPLPLGEISGRIRDGDLLPQTHADYRVFPEASAVACY